MRRALLIDACRCCDGREVVVSASGEVRPCSRCRPAECRAWFEARMQSSTPPPARMSGTKEKP